MDNTKYQFKTNINCGGCINAVKPHLDQIAGVKHWEVDTTHSDKVLTVHGAQISGQQVINAVENAGFRITLLEE